MWRALDPGSSLSPAPGFVRQAPRARAETVSPAAVTCCASQALDLLSCRGYGHVALKVAQVHTCVTRAFRLWALHRAAQVSFSSFVNFVSHVSRASLDVSEPRYF